MAAIDIKQTSGRGGIQNRGSKRALITQAGTDQLEGAAGALAQGMLGTLYVPNIGTTMTIDIYDSEQTTANKIVEWLSADGKGPFDLCIPYVNGLRVVTGGGAVGRAIIVWNGPG